MRLVGSSTTQPDAAGAAFRAALDLAGSDLRLTVELLVQLAAVEYILGRRREALELAEGAEPIAEQVGDSALLALVVGAVAFFEGDLTGEIQSARFERAIALEEEAGTHTGEDSAAYDYGQELLDAWELEPARAIFQRLVATARADGHGTLAQYLDNLAFVELCAGNLAAAWTLAHEAVDLATQIGRTTTEVYALFRLGWIEGLRGNVDAARVACERSLRLGRRRERLHAGSPTLARLPGELTEHYDTASAYLDPSNPATGELPPERPVVHVPEMVEVLAALGRTDEARAKLAPFADRAAQLRRRWALARVAHCRGLILAADADLGTAEGTLEDAVAQAVDNGWPVPLGRALLSLGSVQRRRRHKADARRSLERAVALFDEAGTVTWRDRARRELGRIGGRSAPAGDDLSPTERESPRSSRSGARTSRSPTIFTSASKRSSGTSPRSTERSGCVPVPNSSPDMRTNPGNPPGDPPPASPYRRSRASSPRGLHDNKENSMKRSILVAIAAIATVTVPTGFGRRPQRRPLLPSRRNMSRGRLEHGRPDRR